MRRIVLMCLTIVFVLGCFSTVVWADQDKVLTVVSPWKIRGLDLDKSGFLFARMGCLEMLTTADENGRIVGLLAESWQVNPDKLTWTFRLRQNVRLHDQSMLTAKAAARSLNIALKRKGALGQAKVVEITAVGPHLLQIKTSEPFSSLLAYLAHYSTGIVSEASFDETDNIKAVYGTGQYVLDAYEGGTLFRFKANPNYWGEKPRIERTEYHAVSKGETRGFMMKAGQADMAFTLSPMDAAQLESAGRVKVETMTIPRTRLILLNCSLPLFSDVRVRRAISMAIDRKAIAAGLLRHPDLAATQLLPPAAAMWHDPELAPLAYDPDTAKSLLAQTGWKPGSDGILVKDGRRFEFELDTYAARPMLPPIATAIQEQLKQVGIKMNIRVGEDSQIPEKNAAGTLEAAFMARNFGQIPDAFGTIFSDYGPTPGNWGTKGWQSEELNRLLAEYLGAFYPAKAEELRHGILSVLQAELPVIPVTWYEHIVAISDRLEGVRIDPFEIKSYVRGARWSD